MLFLDGTGSAGVAIASVTDLIGQIKAALAFIWSIFGNLVDTIASNPLLLWSVGFAIVCGAIGVGLKVVRKFGLKGRRS